MTSQLTFFETDEPGEIPHGMVTSGQTTRAKVFTPRKYQREAIASIEAQFGLVKTPGVAPVKSTMVVLATGCGKTEVFVDVTRRHIDYFGRALFVAHTSELIGQIAKKIFQRTGIFPDIEQGDQWSNERGFTRKPYVVATRQSLHEGRLKRFRDFGLLVTDEAHHFSGDNASYKDIWDHLRSDNPNCCLLGVTATPIRADGSAMGAVFETCAYNYGIAEATNDGFLCSSRVNCVTVKSMDLSGVKVTNGEFNQKQLARILEDDKTIYEIACATIQEGGDRLKTIIFCATVDEAEKVSNVLNERFGAKYDWICGDLTRRSKQQRKTILNKFLNGELTGLVNVAVLTEGFDAPGLLDPDTGEVLDPGVEHIVMARPTKSIAVYQQMYGRGTRCIPGTVDNCVQTPEARKAAIAASAKPFVRITDLVDNSNKHRLITAVDVLGGEYPQEVLDDARAEIEKNHDKDAPVDLAAQLEKASAAHKRKIAKQEEEAKERERLAGIAAKACLERFEVNPFDTTGRHYTEQKKIEPATDGQIKYLKQRKFDRPERLTKQEATKVIVDLKRRVSMRDIQAAFNKAERDRVAQTAKRASNSHRGDEPANNKPRSLEEINRMLMG